MLYINNQLIEENKFPDGTPLMKLNNIDLNNVSKENPITITWLYDNDSEAMRLMFLTKHLQAQGYKNIILIMPYIPNARFDRVKADYEVFTLKYFAEFINSLNFSKVYSLDPHSYVSEALINRIVPIAPDKMIDNVINDIPSDIRENLILFFPDEGAMKRYSGLANKYNLRYVFASKNRDWKTGEIKGLTVHGNDDSYLTGRHVLIIDDICSKGGTFYHSAKKLRDLGVNNIYLYISHCENTIIEGDLYSSDMVKKIYTTNSIFRNEFKRDNITTIINSIDVMSITDFTTAFDITL